jgi:hypothetical protein
MLARGTGVRLAIDGFWVVVNYAGHIAEAEAVFAEITGKLGKPSRST